jgi:hypothetical protein
MELVLDNVANAPLGPSGISPAVWALYMGDLIEQTPRELDVAIFWDQGGRMQDELDRVYLHNLSYSESHGDDDITTDSGFARAIFLVLLLKCGGTMAATPHDASWSPFTAKATGRDGRPHGKTSLRHVKHANTMCTRLGLLLEIAHLRGCNFVVLTHPVSTMFETEPFLRVMRLASSLQVPFVRVKKTVGFERLSTFRSFSNMDVWNEAALEVGRLKAIGRTMHARCQLGTFFVRCAKPVVVPLSIATRLAFNCLGTVKTMGTPAKLPVYEDDLKNNGVAPRLLRDLADRHLLKTEKREKAPLYASASFVRDWVRQHLNANNGCHDNNRDDCEVFAVHGLEYPDNAVEEIRAVDMVMNALMVLRHRNLARRTPITIPALTLRALLVMYDQSPERTAALVAANKLYLCCLQFDGTRQDRLRHYVLEAVAKFYKHVKANMEEAGNLYEIRRIHGTTTSVAEMIAQLENIFDGGDNSATSADSDPDDSVGSESD